MDIFPLTELFMNAAGETASENTGILSGVTFWEIALLVPSLILLGIAYRDLGGRYSSLVRGAGSLVFGLFWLTQTFIFLEPAHFDIVNGMVSLLGALLFFFIAVHCYLDHRWNESTKSIGWLMRTAFLTGSIYFILEHIPATQGALIYIVAWATYGILVLTGHDVTIQAGFPPGGESGLLIPSGDPTDASIRIVFACTAALALFLFSSAVIATRTNRDEWKGWAYRELKNTRDSSSTWIRSRRNGIKNILRMSDLRRKSYALLAVIPLIFVSNILRNVAVISVVYGGHISFYDAHNIYAKVLSLVMMVILTWVLFEFLPELQEDMMGLFDLFKRVKKGMMVNGRLDLRYIQKQPRKK
ncbi:MAG: hypothetical protein U9R75_04305 [Candidatus Thermoplasmatota archaeon]|nr:hypothetical protein [Candidatus Thermoplasmatota archaeon]